MKKLVRILSLLIFAMFIWGVVKTQAQAPHTPTDDEVNAVARQLYCPVCENIPLDVCPTQACAEWRDLIRLKLSEGWSADQIKAYFAQQYGDRVLAAPPARGLNWLVYVLPPIAILAGVYILFRVFKDWKQPSASAAATGNPAVGTTEDLPTATTTPSSATSTSTVSASDDPYIARLEEELKKR
jgi:cytochrome c-type biogenesis protein CcmH